MRSGEGAWVDNILADGPADDMAPLPPEGAVEAGTGGASPTAGAQVQQLDQIQAALQDPESFPEAAITAALQHAGGRQLSCILETSATAVHSSFPLSSTDCPRIRRPAHLCSSFCAGDTDAAHAYDAAQQEQGDGQEDAAYADAPVVLPLLYNPMVAQQQAFDALVMGPLLSAYAVQGAGGISGSLAAGGVGISYMFGPSAPAACPQPAWGTIKSRRQAQSACWAAQAPAPAPVAGEADGYVLPVVSMAPTAASAAGAMQGHVLPAFGETSTEAASIAADVAQGHVLPDFGEAATKAAAAAAADAVQQHVVNDCGEAAAPEEVEEGHGLPVVGEALTETAEAVAAAEVAKGHLLPEVGKAPAAAAAAAVATDVAEVNVQPDFGEAPAAAAASAAEVAEGPVPHAVAEAPTETAAAPTAGVAAGNVLPAVGEAPTETPAAGVAECQCQALPVVGVPATAAGKPVEQSVQAPKHGGTKFRVRVPSNVKLGAAAAPSAAPHGSRGVSEAPPGSGKYKVQVKLPQASEMWGWGRACLPAVPVGRCLDSERWRPGWGALTLFLSCLTGSFAAISSCRRAMSASPATSLRL